MKKQSQNNSRQRQKEALELMKKVHNYRGMPGDAEAAANEQRAIDSLNRYLNLGFGGGSAGGAGVGAEGNWGNSPLALSTPAEEDYIRNTPLPFERSFTDAFKAARAAGAQTFKFNNKLYTTELSENPQYSKAEYERLILNLREILDSQQEPYEDSTTVEPYIGQPIGEYKRSEYPGIMNHSPLSYADGGQLNNIGLNYFATGGTHEENPNQGIPQGADEQGTPNVVEQGEIKDEDDYIYSNRVPLDEDAILVAGLPLNYANLTAASALRKASREAEERPYDEISQRTLNDLRSKIKTAQELTNSKYANMIETEPTPQYETGSSIPMTEYENSQAQQGPIMNAYGGPLNKYYNGMDMQVDSTTVNPPTAPASQDATPAVKRADFPSSYYQDPTSPYDWSTPEGVEAAIQDMWPGAKIIDNTGTTQFGTYFGGQQEPHGRIHRVTIQTLTDPLHPATGQLTNASLDKLLNRASILLGNYYTIRDTKALLQHPEILGQGDINKYTSDIQAYQNGANQVIDEINGPIKQGWQKEGKKWVDRYAPDKLDSDLRVSHYGHIYSNAWSDPIGPPKPGGLPATPPTTTTSTPISGGTSTLGTYSAGSTTGTRQPKGINSNTLLAEQIKNFNSQDSDSRFLNSTKQIITRDLNKIPEISSKSRAALTPTNPAYVTNQEKITPRPLQTKAGLDWDTIAANAAQAAPIIGSGLQVIGDMFGANRPDYTDANIIRDNTIPVTSSHIGDYMNLKPLDRDYLQNQLFNQAAGTQNALQNAANGNRGQYMAGLLGLNQNVGTQLGSLARNAAEYNNTIAEKNAAFNRGTNQFNAQQDLTASQANAVNRLNSAKAQAELRDRISTASSNATSNNISNFYNQLGQWGKEQKNYGMIENNPYYEYFIDSKTGKFNFKAYQEAQQNGTLDSIAAKAEDEKLRAKIKREMKIRAEIEKEMQDKAAASTTQNS